jgi:hypothetical protein
MPLGAESVQRVSVQLGVRLKTFSFPRWSSEEGSARGGKSTRRRVVSQAFERENRVQIVHHGDHRLLF